MSIDNIADFLSKIKNAYMRKKGFVECPYFKVLEDLCSVLKEANFISDFKSFKPKEGFFKMLHVNLLYKDGKPSLLGLRRVSRSGKRVYVGYKDVRSVLGGLGISVLTTSRGFLSGNEARKRKLGGEVVCEIW